MKTRSHTKRNTNDIDNHTKSANKNNPELEFGSDKEKVIKRKSKIKNEQIDTHKSSVFNGQQTQEDREPDPQSSPQDSEIKKEEKGSSNSIGNTKYFGSHNLQVVPVEQANRVTIKDIINSHKFTGKRKKRTKKAEVASPSHKSDKVDEETKVTSPPKPAMLHKRITLVNGKVQIDQSSLMIEESNFRRAEDDPKNFKVINDDEYTTSNALIYPRKSNTKKWSDEETELFFKFLEEWGTDFTMIESKFKGARNRTQIKNKFKKEETNNPEKVEAALARTYTKKYGKKREEKEKSKAKEE
ncbi:unnamed protein product [Moneuplotes crassus]|uniref:Myb-like domain-containing protein n=1 Tax=Euplotes crassus TaxID=5936 RepID=A0AAD1XKM1_EUPCR|nr:unnamed protein product [Moneuplotes crassus]